MTFRVFEESVSCVSPSRVQANLDAIRQFVAASGGGDGTPLWCAIRALQSPEVALVPTHRRPCLIWDGYDARGVSCVLRDLMAIETLAPDCAYTEEERRRREPIVRDGLCWLERSFPSTYRVFCDVVAFVVLAKQPGYTGGSVSNRLGFVWLAPCASWIGRDCGEHLYHEFIHQSLFVEDMVGGLFRDTSSMTSPDRLAFSAIRGLPRRYDQSYHSAFVASGIIEYRARASDIAGARALLPALWLCLDALDRERELLTDNGEEQLDQLVDCVFRQADELAQEWPAASQGSVAETGEMAPQAYPSGEYRGTRGSAPADVRRVGRDSVR